MSINISMRQMLEAGVHFGHRQSNWSPKMSPFIFGVRQGIHIINLEETLPRFRDALLFVHRIAAKNGKVLFVGTKFAAREVVREEASRCGMPFVDHRWLGGMLTNYKTIRQSIKRLEIVEEKLADEEYIAGITKKEVLRMMRERDKLHTNLSGVRNMGGLPDVLFVIDVGLEKIAIQEAKRLGIPVVGVVDTNTNPDGIDFAIPGNDDAVRAIRFYCKAMADVVLQAQGEMALEKAKTVKHNEETKPAKKIVSKKEKVAESVAAKKSDEVEVELEVVAEEAKKPAKKAEAKKAEVKKTTAKKSAKKSASDESAEESA